MLQKVGRRAVVLSGAALLLPAACSAPATSATPATATAGPPDTPAATASSVPTPRRTPSPTPSGLTRKALQARVTSYLAERVGSYALAVHDRRSGVVLSVGSRAGETLSTVKVLVAVAVLRELQEQGRWLTAEEQRLMTAMIGRSDNAATNTLVARLGRDSVAEEVADLRLTATTFRPDGAWWGYSTTTPEDLLLVVDALVDGRTGLPERSERFLLDAMGSVTWTQHWGVSSPPLPTGLTVRTKNGWGPMADGYRVNTVGHVLGDGRDHSMAVLGTSPLGFSYGRTTVSRLAELVHTALEQRLV